MITIGKVIFLFFSQFHLLHPTSINENWLIEHLRIIFDFLFYLLLIAMMTKVFWRREWDNIVPNCKKFTGMHFGREHVMMAAKNSPTCSALVMNYGNLWSVNGPASMLKRKPTPKRSKGKVLRQKCSLIHFITYYWVTRLSCQSRFFAVTFAYSAPMDILHLCFYLETHCERCAVGCNWHSFGDFVFVTYYQCYGKKFDGQDRVILYIQWLLCSIKDSSRYLLRLAVGNY